MRKWETLGKSTFKGFDLIGKVKEGFPEEMGLELRPEGRREKTESRGKERVFWAEGPVFARSPRQEGRLSHEFLVFALKLGSLPTEWDLCRCSLLPFRPWPSAPASLTHPHPQHCHGLLVYAPFILVTMQFCSQDARFQAKDTEFQRR